MGVHSSILSSQGYLQDQIRYYIEVPLTVPGIADTILRFFSLRGENTLTKRETKCRTATSGHSGLSVTRGVQAGWPHNRNTGEVIQFRAGSRLVS